MTAQIGSLLRRIAYLLVLGFIATYLCRQGVEPWKTALQLWPVLIGVMIVAPFALAVQAVAFQYCLPANSVSPSLARLIQIWATASITSCLAPLIAGLAVRTTLLIHDGLEIKAGGLATLRQTWINIDYAWITASVLLVVHPWPQYSYLGYGLVGAWLISKFVRKRKPRSFLRKHEKLSTLFEYWPKQSIKAQPWLWGQIFIMGFNYWLAFNLGGVSLSWQMSLLLACVTILSSVVIFIPQGIGVLDALWVWIATHQGLSLSEGVALALTMRCGFLCGAGLVWGLLSLRLRLIRERANTQKR